MSFQIPYDIVGMRRQLMEEEAMRQRNELLAQQQRQEEQQRIFNGIMQLGGVVKGFYDQKNQAEAMDKGVGMMSDLGVINPDTRDKFMNLDRTQKPFVFDLLRQGMFAPYAAGQSAAAQAQAWDQYRGGGGGGMPGGAPSNAVRVYFGP